MATLAVEATPDQAANDRSDGSGSRRDVYFEIAVKRGERWVIDGISRNRDGALKAARNLLQLGEHEGVRVTKEVVNKRTGAAASLVVFERLVAKQYFKRSLLTGAGQVATRQPPTNVDGLDRSWFDQPLGNPSTQPKAGSTFAKGPDDAAWRRVTAGIIAFLGLATAAATILAVFT